MKCPITRPGACASCPPTPWTASLMPRAIPTKLREYAGLQKEVVVIGSFDRAEIWNAERWAREEAMAFESGSLEQAMEELGL